MKAKYLALSIAVLVLTLSGGASAGVGVGVSIDVERIVPEGKGRVYSVKFLCGQIAPSSPSLELGSPLAPGSYRTAVNLHNTRPTGPPAFVSIRAALAPSLGTTSPVPVSPPVEEFIGPFKALEVDCQNIRNLLEQDERFTLPRFIKGFLRIDRGKTKSLNVVAVYTLKNVETITSSTP